MKKTHNKLTCLFGHHDYSKRATRDKDGNLVHLCKICRRIGYYKWQPEGEHLYKYNERGTLIYEKWGCGYEFWKNNYGRWINSKPENWKYEIA